jgi:hypothetical protein
MRYWAVRPGWSNLPCQEPLRPVLSVVAAYQTTPLRAGEGIGHRHDAERGDSKHIRGGFE